MSTQDRRSDATLDGYAADIDVSVNADGSRVAFYDASHDGAWIAIDTDYVVPVPGWSE